MPDVLELRQATRGDRAGEVAVIAPADDPWAHVTGAWIEVDPDALVHTGDAR